jgi:RNA polymerase sigma factor (sigma-70 family)
MTNEERNRLIIDYMPLANRLAWNKCKNTPPCVGIDDLKSAAYMGLVDAASRYNEFLGIAFGVFARTRIWGEICDYLRELRWGGQTNAQVVSLDTSTCISYIQHEQNEFFDITIKNLNFLGSRILRLYYVEGYTMKEIGKFEGLSESRVSQILKNCRNSIKEGCDEEELFAEIAA